MENVLPLGFGMCVLEEFGGMESVYLVVCS